MKKTRLPQKITKLHRVRKIMGMTQEQLATAMNISTRMLQAVELGQRAFSRDMKIRLSYLTGIDPDNWNRSGILPFVGKREWDHHCGEKFSFETYMRWRSHRSNNFSLWLGTGAETHLQIERIREISEQVYATKDIFRLNILQVELRRLILLLEKSFIPKPSSPTSTRASRPKVRPQSGPERSDRPSDDGFLPGMRDASKNKSSSLRVS